MTESAVYKLRKHVEQVDDTLEDEEDVGDDFENLYKGEISKSGTPILPSKRARKIPEKIQVSKEDIEELMKQKTLVSHQIMRSKQKTQTCHLMSFLRQRVKIQIVLQKIQTLQILKKFNFRIKKGPYKRAFNF